MHVLVVCVFEVVVCARVCIPLGVFCLLLRLRFPATLCDVSFPFHLNPFPQISAELGLNEMRERTWQILPCSARTGDGLQEGESHVSH